MSWEKLGPVLQAIGVAEAAGEQLDLAELADALNATEYEIRARVEVIEGYGLAHSGWGEVDEPFLRDSGRQYLRVKGQVDHDILRFLPAHIDDLNARRALLRGGSVLVDEFRYAIGRRDGPRFAREIAPPAFAPLIDERVALDLFAAAVALMARLSAGAAAGCVAEEIVAISLIARAEAWLDMEQSQREIEADEFAAAQAQLQGLFALFEDDDVLKLFGMQEPADAAVSRHDPIDVQLGVVDQRMEAWFRPFSEVPPTGYLHEPR